MSRKLHLPKRSLEPCSSWSPSRSLAPVRTCSLSSLSFLLANPPKTLHYSSTLRHSTSGHNARRHFRQRRWIFRLRFRRRCSPPVISRGTKPLGLLPPPRPQAPYRSPCHLVGPRQLPPRIVLHSTLRRWLLQQRGARREGGRGETQRRRWRYRRRAVPEDRVRFGLAVRASSEPEELARDLVEDLVAVSRWVVSNVENILLCNLFGRWESWGERRKSIRKV